MCGSDIFLGLIALLFPPLPVWVKRGICSADSLINLALCCLGVLPGVLHAWYIIATSPDPTYTQVPPDEESGHVTYYYVQAQPQYRPGGAPQAKVLGKPAGYGTVSNTLNAQFPSQSAGFVEPPAPSTDSQPQAGPSGEVAAPPTYQQAVGDHKVQHP